MICYSDFSIENEFKEQVDNFCSLNSITITKGMLGNVVIHGSPDDICKFIKYYKEISSLSEQRDRKLKKILSKGFFTRIKELWEL